jgi:site-specific DNA-methyltransferase (adenine-specific)
MSLRYAPELCTDAPIFTAEERRRIELYEHPDGMSWEWHGDNRMTLRGAKEEICRWRADHAAKLRGAGEGLAVKDGDVITGDGWEIRCGKWQDSPLDTCDHVISDPPYDERTHKGGRNRQRPGFDAAKTFPPINPTEIAAPLLASAKRWCVLFCAVEQLGRYQDAVGDAYVRGGIWLKKAPQPQLSGDRPAQWGDGIAIMHRKGRKRWNHGGAAARWIFQQVPHAHHETEKPLPLMLSLVDAFTDPGDLVWDPYCGSGTTGVACLRLGRRFIGHEMQPHYAQMAAERLQAEERGLTLQQARAGQLSIMDRLNDV